MLTAAVQRQDRTMQARQIRVINSGRYFTLPAKPLPICRTGVAGDLHKPAHHLQRAAASAI